MTKFDPPDIYKIKSTIKNWNNNSIKVVLDSRTKYLWGKKTTYFSGIIYGVYEKLGKKSYNLEGESDRTDNFVRHIIKDIAKEFEVEFEELYDEFSDVVYDLAYDTKKIMFEGVRGDFKSIKLVE